MDSRTSPWLFAALACLATAHAAAFDALTFKAREVVAGEVRLASVAARLALGEGRHTDATLTIGRARPGPNGPELRNLRLHCPMPVIADPEFGCERAQLSIAHTPIGPQSIALSAAYRADRSVGEVRAAIASLAGGRLELHGRSDPAGWRADGNAAALDLAALRALVAPWFPLPAGWTLDGTASATFAVRGGDEPLHAETTWALSAVNLSNEASTIIAEGAAVTVGLSLDARRDTYAVAARVRGERGQALAGPILLDFNRNPLALEAVGRWAGETLTFEQLSAVAPGLLALHGTATVALGDAPKLATGRLEITSLEFPAAYTSLMQITLAATDFGDLITAGSASGTVELADNAPVRVGLRLAGVSAHNDREFFMKDVAGELHWAAGRNADVAPSWLTWSSGGAYGLSGGSSRIDFVTRAANFVLAEPWHMPIFDGALDVRTLAITGLGSQAMSVRFDADIDPISLPPLCKAFGWPEFSGRIGGRIPGVELRGDELTVNGNIEANVFDGIVVASHLRLVDPLGKWPRLYADVRGRNLDLDLVTRAFAFGTITGRLDADILGLELFNWSPVAFDARLETPAGDRSRHRISAKAVKELSNVGGGGGGVTQALQSGVLRFFDEYSYDRIGIRCRLRNDVCLMAGVEPAANGYYIVKGRGLPRIDIIGNQGRVNWRQLVSQIASGLEARDVVVE
ncbi:MAG: hypothetical protein AB7G76_02125 [Steroidobacteraceae bacterium]